MTFAFTLEVSGIDTEQENYGDALHEAGCDDALIAVVNGTMFLDFHRDGLTFEDAVKSASRNVELAGGRVVRVLSTPANHAPLIAGGIRGCPRKCLEWSLLGSRF